MKDRNFERDTTKKGTKKGAGRPITHGTDIDEQLLTWLLDAHDKQLPITTQILRAKALELITPNHPHFKASDGWYKSSNSATRYSTSCDDHYHKSCRLHLKRGSSLFIPSFDGSKKSTTLKS